MSYNNSVTINDCITELQTLNDFNSDIDSLRAFAASVALSEDDSTRLKKLITLMTIKNTRVKNKVNKTMNKLNKLGYY